MSTNNFKFENILIAIPDFNFTNPCEKCVAEGCEDSCEEQYESEEFDDYAYDEYITEMRNHLDDIKVAKNIGQASLDEYDSDRNYGGKIIYEFDILDKNEFSYKKIYVVIRNGYYKGANIDYAIDDNFSMSNASNAEMKKLDKQVEVLCKKIEKVLRKYGGTELLKVAQFSNGEAMYQIKKQK